MCDTSLLLGRYILICKFAKLRGMCDVYVHVLQERMPLDQVFEELNCSKEGLTNEEGQKRLEIFGPNKLEEKKAMNRSLSG